MCPLFCFWAPGVLTDAGDSNADSHHGAPMTLPPNADTPRRAALCRCVPHAAIVLAMVLVAGLLAGPAQAQLSYGFESRFGVVYQRDHETGESRTRPYSNARLTIRWDHQLDNGVRFQLALGLDAGNLQQRRSPHWHHWNQPHPGD